MNPKLTKKLFKKYSKIFIGKNKSIKENLMPFGFECGDGWYNLLDCLCSKLQFDTDHNNKECKYPQVEAVQVKEKFGTLRFYVAGATPEQYAAISLAELMSSRICEVCGKFSEDIAPCGPQWITTRCKECMKTAETRLK